METASLQPIYLVFNYFLTSVLVEASAMTADLDDRDPGDPGKPGKDIGKERDFRVFDDTDDEDEPDLPRHLQQMSLRLHVHFSF